MFKLITVIIFKQPVYVLSYIKNLFPRFLKIFFSRWDGRTLNDQCKIIIIITLYVI